MTLEEKTKNEGRLEGEIKGLKEGIEMGVAIRFPENIDEVMAGLNEIDDQETLKEITKAIYTAKEISEIMALLK